MALCLMLRRASRICCESAHRLKSIRASSSGVIISSDLWSCDLGQPPQLHDEVQDYLNHQGTTIGFTELHAVLEDLVFVSHRGISCVLSPTRFPGQWKILPRDLSGSVLHLCAGRLGTAREPLLVGVEWLGSINRFCFQRGCWRQTMQYAPMIPLARSVWFKEAIYVFAVNRRVSSWDSDAEESDSDPEPAVLSMMRFDEGTSQWEELEMSERDKATLNSGMCHLVLLQGRLLVFLLPWPYLESRGCDLHNEGLWRVEAGMVGEGKRLMVFQLVDDGSEPPSATKKKLVDVSGEFSSALDLAAEQNATNFFNNDTDEGAGVFFWVTSRGEVAGFSMLTNQVFTSAGLKLQPPRGWIDCKPANTFHNAMVLHHTDLTPPGEQSLMVSLFSGLKDLKF